ncbi:histidine--tRNA ligase [Halorhabdus salina]|uniref:histidine--tRNA ligase n=1 Tax=Halorhabdus salina TaxID=2750670 RepID=UPI00215D7C9B|nr:histidine--tRNA ligase [Halorhabdus salina]
MAGERVLVPEKGRNAGAALSIELDGEGYDLEWIRSLINGKGKRAAKTGEGFEELQAQIDRLNAINDTGDPDTGYTDQMGTFRIGFKHFGRLNPRPVLEKIEFTDRRIEGYESPRDAWEQGASRFYAGYDAILEELLGYEDVDVSVGFESAVEAVLADRGYQRTGATGSDVTWAAMSGDDEIPERPEAVLVPESFRRLGAALARVVWDEESPLYTYDEYAHKSDIDFTDEEQVLADAKPGVAGIYMFVTGGTAREFGLAIEPIEGAQSRLGIFETETQQTMVETTSLKGMYDRLPGEFSAWRALIDVVEQTAREFGFREINTPAVERTELYRVKSGEELLEQTYSFEDRGGREVTLTPEQTPTRARIVQQRKDLSTPIKWVDTSKRWRYENVQKGRDREFFQTDIDIFGIESVAADAEVIACGATIYQKLGVEDSVEFLINDRNLLESILQAEGVENTQATMEVIDDKEKLEEAEFRTALTESGLSAEQAELVDDLTDISGPITEAIDELEAIAPDDPAAQTAVDRMASLADHLDAYDVAQMCNLDLSIVRGLAYYTGLVFEAFDTRGELRALFGGGRYDELVGLFGDQDVPAVGFAFGYSTTRELLKREGVWSEETVSTDVYVATVSESVRDVGVELATDLRAEGLTVETDLADRNLGSQFGYADGINATYAIVVGERDLENDEVTLRDMASGDEENVPVDDLVEIVGDRV